MTSEEWTKKLFAESSCLCQASPDICAYHKCIKILREAVAEEMERCAKIADKGHDGGWCPGQGKKGEVCGCVAPAIARAIRGKEAGE
jgi:hypothetical protein